MAQRANVLRAYRELVDLAKRLPAERRDASLKEARKAMRANTNEDDPVRQTDMLKELVAKVSFLRMTTPKTYRDRCMVKSHPFSVDSAESTCRYHSRTQGQNTVEGVCRRLFHAGGPGMDL